MTLRQRVILTLVPLMLLLGILGTAAAVLLYRLGNSINAIMRENYDSVTAMERLDESLERIDSSFQFALAGEQQKARQQYQQNWTSYNDSLKVEQSNITIEGEQELVDQLAALTRRYRDQGERFYARLSGDANWHEKVYRSKVQLCCGLAGLPALGMRPVLLRLALGLDEPHQDYFGPGGLLETFTRIKQVSNQILRLNQDNMEQANRAARHTAQDSLVGFGFGLAAVAVLAGLLAWGTLRSILRPIQAVTQSALSIGAGNLDQVVPVHSRDELGQLAEAFNLMARQLRHYRQTSYAQLLRAQRTSQATIDSFPDPVLVVNSEGQVEMANPAARLLVGAPETQTGQAATLAWQPPEALRQPLEQALREQRPYLPQGFDRAVPLRAQGQELVFLPRILPISDRYGNTLGAAVLFQDVTRFRLLDQVKSDLVATVSHELKTPLTSIRLALHLLVEEAAGPLTPKQTELLLDGRDNAERLLGMINHLLDLTRLEQGREHLDLVAEAPATLLRTAAEAIRPRAEDKGVHVVVEAADDLPRVAADEQRFGHALANLLDNAITYTERGGQITLGAASTGATVTLSVADTGCGIPAEYLPRVFDKFFRVPGQSTGSGTGLGLAIVREIVTAHGGSITCESQPGAGTVFRITLPVWTGSTPRGEGPYQHALAGTAAGGTGP